MSNDTDPKTEAMGYLFKSQRSKSVILTLSFFLVVLWNSLLFALVSGAYHNLKIGCPKSWDGVRPGQQEDVVVEALGVPVADCDLKSPSCSNKVSNCIRPPRIPSRRALVYQGCGKCLFVFLDGSGKVVSTQLGHPRL